MAENYKQLPLNQTQPGMVLSDDLLDRQGNVLLPRGVELTATTLASLERHGIEMLPIESGALSEVDQEAEFEHHRQRLLRLFRQPQQSATPPTDATCTLQQYVTNFRLGKSA